MRFNGDMVGWMDVALFFQRRVLTNTTKLRRDTTFIENSILHIHYTNDNRNDHSMTLCRRRTEIMTVVYRDYSPPPSPPKSPPPPQSSSKASLSNIPPNKPPPKPRAIPAPGPIPPIPPPIRRPYCC